MILGKAFYGNLGSFLLKKHAVLTDSLVRRIRNLGYSGLYIAEDFSDGIEPDFLVSDDLKSSTASAVRTFMSVIETNSSSDSALIKSADDIMGLVRTLVDEILGSNNAVVNIIDLKSYDLYTYQHSVNVAVLSGVIGAAMSIPKNQIIDLVSSAIFHDIGKMFVSKEVLNKPGALNKQEIAEIQNHPALGAIFLRDRLSFNPAIYTPVERHHERYDGLGYPQGISGDGIGLHAQVIAMTDAFDAITSKRPYHDAIMPHEGCEYIMGNAGRHFDPKAVDVFFRTVAPFPVGVSVRLSNGLEGIVYKNYPNFPMRPIIKIRPAKGEKARYLNLCNDPNALNVTIQKIL